MVTWLQRALWDVVPRDHRESPQRLRRRQIVTVAFVAIGTVVLGFSLRIAPGNAWFYPATLGRLREHLRIAVPAGVPDDADPNFFVPLNAFTPRQYRVQEQIVFNF